MSDLHDPKNLPSDDEARRALRRMTRRSFTTGALAALAGLGGWQWLRTRDLEDGIPWPLRRVLRFNEALSRAAFRADGLAPTFDRDRAREPRVNGGLGLSGGIDPARWRLHYECGARTGSLTLQEIKALPRTEMVTELKCIEGWSEVVHWAGVRFRDFVTHHRLGARGEAGPDLERRQNLFSYVFLETPDRSYYVGLDVASALHPQTLLCYEMNGQPLTSGHGAPLRLVTAVKYGIKSIKRIGLIRFSDERPADYWAERGYDWYAGH
jgi:hypothetical protein